MQTIFTEEEIFPRAIFVLVQMGRNKTVQRKKEKHEHQLSLSKEILVNFRQFLSVCPTVIFWCLESGSSTYSNSPNSGNATSCLFSYSINITTVTCYM